MMALEIHWVEVTCPMCGWRNKYHANDLSRNPEIVMCDCDDGGGCGRWFAVECTVQVKTKTYNLVDADRKDAG